MTTEEVLRLRADTPGCEERIHLNNAGSGLMPQPVVDAIKDHIDLEARMGGYEAEADRAEAVKETYTALGALLGAPAENIAVTENATASFVQALSSIPFKRGDTLVTSRNDYISNQIMYLSLQARMGIEIVRVPDLPEGGIDVTALEGIVHRKRPKLVAVTHIPTNSGLVQNVMDVGQVCRNRDTFFLLDACQSVGQMPIDVGTIGCDFLSATARKFLRGPRGIGFLYVSDEALDSGIEPLFPDMRGAEWIEADIYQPSPTARRFENWEFAYALVLGLGAAATYALDLGLEEIRNRTWHLSDELRTRLSEVPGLRILDRGEIRSAIVTATLPGVDAADVVERLSSRGVNSGVSLRDYAVLDFDDKGVQSALRLSPHYYNTSAEIQLAADIVAEMAQESV